MGLRTAYGPVGTLRARIIRETFGEWFQVIQALSGTDEMELLEQSWTRAKHDLSEAGYPVRMVRGLMSNVMYLVHGAGWTPVSVSKWLDPDNQLFMLNHNVSPDIVSSLLTKAYLSSALVVAAKGYNGKGMEGGVDFDSTLNFIRRSRSVDYPDKCTLEAIMANCMWPADRIYQINPSFAPLCPRCGLEPETALHCFWTCRCNEKPTTSL